MRLMSALLATLVAVTGFAGCSYRNEEINRVVNPYWSKDYFSKENAWYYRTTIVDSPPEQGWLSIADGDWLMLDRIRWEVTERFLIGWRDYNVVPGADNDQYAGAEDVYQGEPVAIFPITDHFDIRREFDPTTGEESNVVSENRDRLWHDRAFVRVDWSANRIDTYKFHIWINQIFDTVPVVNNDVGDPKRWRFEDDYFEITTRTRMAPDILSYFGFYGMPYMGDTAGELVDMRHSFMKVPKSDYEPLAMPPTVFLEDENGDPVLDADGYTERVPVNDRFGFFGTLGRNQFDANRGMVTSGQIFNATRFSIWKKSKNADGTSIPAELREPKPIVYYTNVDMPHTYKNGVRRVESQWNRVFRDLIWKVQPSRYTGALDDTGIPEDVPPMFVLKENSCNVANVKNVLASLPRSAQEEIRDAAEREGYGVTAAFDGTIGSVETRLAHASDYDDNTAQPHTDRVREEAQAHADLERICSALEYTTGGDRTLGVEPLAGVEPFIYQRLGDTRFSMMNTIPGVFQSGWSGLGPPYADPVTGETISATANVAAWTIDRSATRAAQWVEVMNGQVDPTDFTWGYNIEAYMRQKLLQMNGLTTWKPEEQAYENMDRYFEALRGSAVDGDVRAAIGEMPPGSVEARLAQVRGSDVEQLLISPDDIMAFGGVLPNQAQNAALDDEDLLERVSFVRGNNHVENFKDRNRRIVQMGQRAMDPPEMIDRFTVGRAIALRDLPYAERFRKLQEDIFVAVMLHEVGHNIGLFHNMAGSSDALNFGQTFWDMQTLPPDIDDAIDALQGSNDALDEDRLAQLENCAALIADLDEDEGNDGEPDFGELDPRAAGITTQDCLRQTELMYSSIMDYHANWNADFGGLGAYDYAAIKFGYGQLLEVFDTDALVDRGNDTRTIKRKIFLDGWQTIPTEVVDGVENVMNRTYVKMDWNTSSTRQAPLPNEVPYKFGWGAQMTPDEKPFDFGADFQTNARNELTRYYDHFFFTHFARNRLWDFDTGINAALNADLAPLFDFTEKMQWYFFFKATDPEFTGSFAEQDLLATTLTGLNFFGQVIGHPSGGLHISVRKSDVFGILNDDPSERTTTPTDIMFPWNDLGECTTRQLAVTADVNDDDRNDGVFASTRAGIEAGIVPLSEGRPFFLGLTDDYEDWYLKYVGSYWSKLYALQLLADGRTWFPRADGSADPRQFNVSWYRLFPKQVSKIYHRLIAEQFADLGPVVLPSGSPDQLGTYTARNLINADGSEPDYTGAMRVYPSISFNHQYYAMLFANALLSTPWDDTMDLPRTMAIALEGSSDDMAAFDNADPADLIEFTHPVSGLTFRGLRVGEYPIAYDLMTRLNSFKERYNQLDACVSDMDDGDDLTDSHLTNSYCFCINYYTDPIEGDCTIERFEAVGTNACTEQTLRNRRDSALESMDDLVDYVNNLRTFNYYLFN